MKINALVLASLLVYHLSVIGDTETVQQKNDWINNCKLAYNNMKVIIDELCVVTQKDDYPKWVLFSFRENMNLKGFYIKDLKDIIYEFKDDMEVSKDTHLLLCFYPGDKISEEFLKMIPQGTVVINVFDMNPFVSEYDMDFVKISYDLFKKQIQKSNIERRIHQISKDFPKIFDEYSLKADKIIQKYRLEEKEKNAMIYAVWRHPRYYGELAVYNPKDQLEAYFNWGRSYFDLHKSKQYEEAYKKYIWYIPVAGEPPDFDYNYIDRKALIFKRDSDIFFKAIFPDEAFVHSKLPTKKAD